MDDLKANSCDITERRNLKDTDVDELYLLKGTKKKQVENVDWDRLFRNMIQSRPYINSGRMMFSGGLGE